MVNPLNQGSGKNREVETDFDGSKHHPYVKLEFGADGTRTKVASDAGLPVDATGSGDVPVTLDGEQVVISSSALPTGAATSANQTTIIGHVDGIEGLLTTIDADTATLAGAVAGTEVQVDVVAALPAGTNNIGDVDVASIAAGTNLVGDVGLSGARTSGGTTAYKNLDVDESEDEVKGTAGQVFWIHAINTTAAPLYLKFYNLTAANTTVGTSTPVLTFPVPGNADSDGAGFTLSVPNGIAFSTAITVACTTGVADNDSGAPGANACILNLGYA